MRFTYQYKTRDGVQHAAEYSASSRVAVYDELKAKGIRPFNVELAPGFWNKLRSMFGWRVCAILLLSFTLVGTLVWSLSRDVSQTSVADDSVFISEVRRQVIGDAGVVEAGIRSGWADVFAEEGDRFLASFAIPGETPAVKSTSTAAIEAALAREVVVTAGDSIEARQIKSIVGGMKKELRKYISDGGTIRQYGERIVERQESEMRCYNFIKTEIEAAAKSNDEQEIVRAWKRGNEELRRMGVRHVPFPQGVNAR